MHGMNPTIIDAEMDRLFAVSPSAHFAAKHMSCDHPSPEVIGIPQTTYCRRYVSLSEVALNLDLGAPGKRAAANSSIERGRLITLCREYISSLDCIRRARTSRSTASSASSSTGSRTSHQGPCRMQIQLFLSSRLRHRMILAQVANMYHPGLRSFRKFDIFDRMKFFRPPKVLCTELDLFSESRATESRRKHLIWRET